mmetsp:Transcript_30874/g.82230  ORF Transcript_30874/g.82230 Transcript_30874/m.82230 type:complete len:467 (+) Transcript_30874:383-1783(+)
MCTIDECLLILMIVNIIRASISVIKLRACRRGRRRLAELVSEGHGELPTTCFVGGLMLLFHRRLRGALTKLTSQRGTHETARLCEQIRGPSGDRELRSGQKRRASLGFVVDGPVRVRDVVLLQKVHPDACLFEVQRPVAVGAACAPLRGEQRHTHVQGNLRLGSQELLVARRIEVQGVCQVVTLKRIRSSKLHVLRPRWGPTNDEVVGVLADGADNHLLVRLDVLAPALLQGLVEDLEEDVREAAIHGGHLVEESASLILVGLRMVIMPVDDHVDAVADGSIHHSHDALFFDLAAFQVPSALHTHRRTNHGDLPVLHEPIHDAFAPIRAAPLRPEQGHATQPDRLSVLAQQLVALDADGAVHVNRGAGRSCEASRDLGTLELHGLKQLAAPRRPKALRVLEVNAWHAGWQAARPVVALREALVSIRRTAPRGTTVVQARCASGRTVALRFRGQPDSREAGGEKEPQ